MTTLATPPAPARASAASRPASRGPASAADSSGCRWTETTSGVWTATVGTAHLGEVTLTGSGYVATDVAGDPVGAFCTLDQAQEAVLAVRGPGASRPAREGRRRRDAVLARVGGCVLALSLVSTAAMLLMLDLGHL
ncbi:hypothetical protein EDF38_0445 [Frigoribacterium sp. PhB160]|uniref:hypothetical protein n=1 Tax=Frigoribacterium sp. PhB160 TaxID=2485192 RepID=UPI000F4841AB|nr:hypothetical protein [Frigoribacterium sp. PhB160]ROS61356.1 hypothetical protein EDF38_0445 [Frigoribacterium sp. PhB160]